MPNLNYGSGLFQQSPQTDAYQRLMDMRNTTPYNNYRTVFNDISDE